MKFGSRAAGTSLLLLIPFCVGTTTAEVSRKQQHYGLRAVLKQEFGADNNHRDNDELVPQESSRAKECTESFTNMDMDKDNVLSLQEFLEASNNNKAKKEKVQRQFINTADDYDYMLRHMDRNHNGQIEKAEFLNSCTTIIIIGDDTRTKKRNEVNQKQFSETTTTIQKKEKGSVHQEKKVILQDDDCTSVFNTVDIDRSGDLDRDEFAEYYSYYLGRTVHSKFKSHLDALFHEHEYQTLEKSFQKGLITDKDGTFPMSKTEFCNRATIEKAEEPQKTHVLLLAHHLQEPEETCQSDFNALDTDNSGDLNVDEFIVFFCVINPDFEIVVNDMSDDDYGILAQAFEDGFTQAGIPFPLTVDQFCDHS